MHDFCLTLPYGLLLVVGGLIGALKAGSMESGLTGGGIGGALLILGTLSLKKYQRVNEQGSTTERYPSMALLLPQICLTIAVTYIMYDRYSSSGKMMPAGMVASISGLMLSFYLYKLVTFSSKPAASTSTKQD